MKPKLDNLQIKSIKVPTRARKDYGDLEPLKQSLSTEDIIHPIAVMELKNEEGFLLLAGGRRLQAAIELNWDFIPCRIFPFMEDLRLRKAI